MVRDRGLSREVAVGDLIVTHKSAAGLFRPKAWNNNSRGQGRRSRPPPPVCATRLPPDPERVTQASVQGFQPWGTRALHRSGGGVRLRRTCPRLLPCLPFGQAEASRTPLGLVGKDEVRDPWHAANAPRQGRPLLQVRFRFFCALWSAPFDSLRRSRKRANGCSALRFGPRLRNATLAVLYRRIVPSLSRWNDPPARGARPTLDPLFNLYITRAAPRGRARTEHE